MPLFKKFKPFVGPKRFCFKDPSTGHEFKAESMQELIKAVSGYRSANELDPIEYLPQVLENYICSLPEHAGYCTPAKSPHRSVVMMIEGGIALLKNIAYKDFVDQETADKRSEICYKCPKNQFPDRSKAFINWSNDMANRSVGDRKSKYHDSLGICGICSCPLKSKVFWKGKIKLAPEELAQMKEINCWQPEFAK